MIFTKCIKLKNLVSLFKTKDFYLDITNQNTNTFTFPH